MKNPGENQQGNGHGERDQAPSLSKGTRVRQMEELEQELHMWQGIRLELAQKQRNMVEKFLLTREKFTVLKNRSLSVPATADARASSTKKSPTGTHVSVSDK